MMTMTMIMRSMKTTRTTFERSTVLLAAAILFLVPACKGTKNAKKSSDSASATAANDAERSPVERELASLRDQLAAANDRAMRAEHEAAAQREHAERAEAEIASRQASMDVTRRQYESELASERDRAMAASREAERHARAEVERARAAEALARQSRENSDAALKRKSDAFARELEAAQKASPKESQRIARLESALAESKKREQSFRAEVQKASELRRRLDALELEMELRSRRPACEGKSCECERAKCAEKALEDCQRESNERRKTEEVERETRRKRLVELESEAESLRAAVALAGEEAAGLAEALRAGEAARQELEALVASSNETMLRDRAAADEVVRRLRETEASLVAARSEVTSLEAGIAAGAATRTGLEAEIARLAAEEAASRAALAEEAAALRAFEECERRGKTLESVGVASVRAGVVARLGDVDAKWAEASSRIDSAADMVERAERWREAALLSATIADRARALEDLRAEIGSAIASARVSAVGSIRSSGARVRETARAHPAAAPDAIAELDAAARRAVDEALKKAETETLGRPATPPAGN
jgi:hypothetical protein